MGPINNIEEAIRNRFTVAAGPALHDRVLARVRQTAEQLERTPALRGPVARRMIMRSPIVKLGIAGAIIALVGLGIVEFIGTGATSGVVWAEVARKVQASRGVIFRKTEEIVPDTYDRGVDFTMNHWSSTQSRLDGYKGGQINKTIYSDCNTKTVILVDYYHKSYVKMTDEDTMPGRFGMADPNSTVQRFLSCKHKELGSKTIDGVLCEGIETTDPAFYGRVHPPETPMARVWVSVETGYPVQIEGEYVSDDGQTRYAFVQDQFQWDVDLDESLFEPNVPTDYIDISP